LFDALRFRLLLTTVTFSVASISDLDARPWDFQQEECALRTYVERFNVRRYKITGNAAASSMGVSVNEEFAPVNNNMQNLLSEE